MSCFLSKSLNSIDLKITELLLKYGANPSMYLYTNVTKSALTAFGLIPGGVYRITPYDDITNDEEEELFDYYINIRNLQRRIREKQAYIRRKKMKLQQSLALMRSMDSREGPIGTVRYDPSLVEHISRHLSNMEHRPSVMNRMAAEKK